MHSIRPRRITADHLACVKVRGRARAEEVLQRAEAARVVVKVEKALRRDLRFFRCKRGRVRIREDCNAKTQTWHRHPRKEAVRASEHEDEEVIRAPGRIASPRALSAQRCAGPGTWSRAGSRAGKSSPETLL